MTRMIRLATVAAGTAVVLSQAQVCSAQLVTTSIGGSNAAAIQATVDAFRASLGNPNNANTAGPLASGRREINWDGGGATTTASPNVFNGFQNIRGALFSTPGTGFLQTPPTSAELAAINASYATTFTAFSAQRIFTPVGSNITDITFFIPGTNGAIAATVGGFGSIFSDVDLANTTSMSFFDVNNNLLLNSFVTPGAVANGSQSFLGAIATNGERIARVRITTGNSALGPTDNPAGGVDVVVMDDFIYSEPTAISAAAPEPGSLALLLPAIGGMGLVLRRRFRK